MPNFRAHWLFNLFISTTFHWGSFTKNIFSCTCAGYRQVEHFTLPFRKPDRIWTKLNKNKNDHRCPTGKTTQNLQEHEAETVESKRGYLVQQNLPIKTRTTKQHQHNNQWQYNCEHNLNNTYKKIFALKTPHCRSQPGDSCKSKQITVCSNLPEDCHPSCNRNMYEKIIYIIW
jgi:hypothetical protein